MKEITKRYNNGEVTVVWQPHLCIHSAICFRGLPEVFDPRKRPWITPEGSTTEQIVAQVSKCPSGALSIEKNQIKNIETKNNENDVNIKVHVMSKGPLIVKGNCTVVDENGNETLKEGQVALCRCGASSNKPYCDGSHRKVDVL
ncbi:MAG: (4Fe-4S)-binding protein [Bacteroidia bacterium]|nr:(4Fe-4S)-binding protein [Bacteroidota bacterium]MBK7388155.1 (4Fe-4S)-binding protein [Bacteroidota bacterium]MBK9425098.1 (4Fe-4S)-binding protein [Bacteroidota bacterium]MBP9083384.1 (4Fe-4S)-binding protein [Bacteroidia bacterium]